MSGVEFLLKKENWSRSLLFPKCLNEYCTLDFALLKINAFNYIRRWRIKESIRAEVQRRINAENFIVNCFL